MDVRVSDKLRLARDELATELKLDDFSKFVA